MVNKRNNGKNSKQVACADPVRNSEQVAADYADYTSRLAAQSNNTPAPEIANLLELPFYKHYVPTGRGAASEALVKETRIDRLYN